MPDPTTDPTTDPITCGDEQVNAVDLPDDPDGYLFVVVGGDYYALNRDKLKHCAVKVIDDGGDLAVLLENLVGSGFVLADIDGQGRPDSCACVALNLDKFDATITAKQQKIRQKLLNAKLKMPAGS